MLPNRTRRLIPVTIAILLLAAPSIWLARQHHLLTLNRELIAAIKQSDAQRVESLLAAGADPNTRDTLVKHQSILQRLHDLVHPPPPDLSPTALAAALDVQGKLGAEALGITPRILKALLIDGADPNLVVDDDIRDFYGTAPFELGGQARNPRVITPLDHFGSHADDTGLSYTPLMFATTLHYTACVRILLDFVANPNPKPSFLTTPLSYAEGSDYKDITNLLRSHGAKR